MLPVLFFFVRPAGSLVLVTPASSSRVHLRPDSTRTDRYLEGSGGTRGGSHRDAPLPTHDTLLGGLVRGSL